jgi:hypothetical protein
VLEDDIGWVGELVLEAVAEVGEVLEFNLSMRMFVVGGVSPTQLRMVRLLCHFLCR